MAQVAEKVAVERGVKKERQVIRDAGLDEGIKNLTPEKIQDVVKKVLGPQPERFKMYIQKCMHCGLCGEACHWYLSHDRDPSYGPVGKVKQTLWEILKADGKVSPEFIKKCARTALLECNRCRRCSQYCPFGVDIAGLMVVVGRICGLLGVTPEYVQDTRNSHAAYMNQMWVKQDEWIDTLEWMEEEAQSVVKNARIPLDKEGAEIMYSVIAPEPKVHPHLIRNMAQIMTVAGYDWTMPSFDGWDNSNMAMMVGDSEISGRIVKTHYEAALRLKVKRIVMGECGHAFRGTADIGLRWLGWKQPPVPLIHAVLFYYELLKTGRIKVAKKFKDPLTVHDPCNIARHYSLGKALRAVLKEMCEDFRDVSPGCEYNYCCNGGGGVINSGPLWKKSRVEGNRVKAEQLRATGAKFVVAPCHNCYPSIQDICDYYELGMKATFISEIMVQTMEIPPGLRA